MTKALLFVFAFCISIPKLFAQKNHKKPLFTKQIHLEPYAGISWQSTLFMPVFDFSPMPFLIYRPYPHSSEKGTQGLGLDIGTYLFHPISEKSKVGLRINARNRYDYLYGGFGNSYPEEIKAYILDASAAAVFTFQNKREKDWLFEAGYTVNQVGKEFTFDLTKDGRTSNAYLKMQYSSYNFGFGYDIKKLGEHCAWHLGFVANYIPNGHPGYPIRDFMTLGFRSWFRLK